MYQHHHRRPARRRSVRLGLSACVVVGIGLITAEASAAAESPEPEPDPVFEPQGPFDEDSPDVANPTLPDRSGRRRAAR